MTRVSHSGRGTWGVPPHSTSFLKTPHQNQSLLWDVPHLKMTPHLKNSPPLPPLKSEVPFQEMIPRKKSQKSETVINTFFSIIKHWKKMAEIPQTCYFMTWGIQIFVKKKKK